MARQIKTGLDYFPFDVDFFNDRKIRHLTARFGIKGQIIAIRLLSEIYSEHGYFMDWTEDNIALFADEIGSGCSVALVKDVTQELVKRGFFDEAVFNSYSVLTSKGIQKRYHRICCDAKRKNVQIDEKFRLIEIHSGKTREETQLSRGEMPFTPEVSTQSKVKESKEKDSSSTPGAQTEIATADGSNDDNFFKSITDEALNDHDTLRERIRKLFRYYTRKEPHPQEIGDMLALFENPTFKKRSTYEVVVQAFRDQPARSPEKQNTRYLMKVIQGRLAELRDRTLAKRKQERQRLEYSAPRESIPTNLSAMLSELNDGIDEKPLTVH